MKFCHGYVCLVVLNWCMFLAGVYNSYQSLTCVIVETLCDLERAEMPIDRVIGALRWSRACQASVEGYTDA